MSVVGELLVALALLVAVVGVVVPVLPGALLAGVAVWIWAAVEQTGLGWTVAAVATLLLLASQVVKYLVPGRRLSRAGVRQRTLVVGGLAGLVGFFVVPVVGLPLGFVGGVYAAERTEREHAEAWRATTAALRAVGLSILIEMAAVLLVGGLWGAAAIFG